MLLSSFNAKSLQLGIKIVNRSAMRCYSAFKMRVEPEMENSVPNLLFLKYPLPIFTCKQIKLYEEILSQNIWTLITNVAFNIDNFRISKNADRRSLINNLLVSASHDQACRYRGRSFAWGDQCKLLVRYSICSSFVVLS